MFLCVGRALNLHAGSNVRVMSVANEAPPCSLFYISFCRQRTLSTVRLGKSRGRVKQCRCNQQRKSAMPTTNTRECFLLYHVQNILSGRSHRIRFTSVARHDQRSLIARAHMVGRTTTNSPTRIGMWNVVLHQKKWHQKQWPKATNVTCVNTGRSCQDQQLTDL